MREIYIITTPGCEACNIVIQQILSIRDTYAFDFIKIINNASSIPDFIINNVVLTDFPTVVFVKDNFIKKAIVGTIKFETLIEELKCFD